MAEECSSRNDCSQGIDQWSFKQVKVENAAGSEFDGPDSDEKKFVSVEKDAGSDIPDINMKKSVADSLTSSKVRLEMPCEWPSKVWATEMVGVEDEESSEKVRE
ncbi:hypothetical protein ACE6H2_013278 [Prunus campanulata]